MELRRLFTTKNLLLFLLMILSVFLLAKLDELALMLFIAFVLACSLNQPVDALSKFMSRRVATVISILAALALTLGVLVPVLVVVLKEIKGFIDVLPNKLMIMDRFLHSHRIADKTFAEILNVDSIANTQKVAHDIALFSWDLTSGIFGGFAIVLVLLIIIYYFVAEKDLLTKNFVLLFPHKYKKKAEEVVLTISKNLGGYVIAQLFSTAVIGVVVTLGLTLLNVKYALVLGFMAAVLDLIPIVGPTIATIIAVLATYQDGWVHVLLVVAVYLVAQGIQNYAARPMIFGKYMDMHPLVVILSFLIAAKFVGVWGVIFAPAIASLFLTIFDELYIKVINQDKHD